MVERAQQGHRYRIGDDDVLALESGSDVLVAVIEPGAPWFVEWFSAPASMLEPLPMRYFHGQVPK